ncbi:unnamed protein product [Ophioblennius macclurei]
MHSGSWILIILLSFVIISSAADPETLNASVGGNITLPDAVEEKGFLLYEGKAVAKVHEKKLLEIYEENNQNRIHWNQTTGRFTLTGLQKSDSGIYTVDSKKGRRVYVQYKLSVHDPAENEPSRNGAVDTGTSDSTDTRPADWIPIVIPIVCVVIIVPLIAVVLWWFCFRKRSSETQTEESERQAETTV